MYRTTKFLTCFYNLKIGLPWADPNRRVEVGTALDQCCDEFPPEPERHRGMNLMLALT